MRNRPTTLRRTLITATHAAAALALWLLAGSCSNIDCPLGNTVAARYAFYDMRGAKATFGDTITVRAAGSDTVLFNKGTNLQHMEIPVSYRNQADTLLLDIAGSKTTRTDTIIMKHTNEAHFESIDCGPAMFHKITSVTLRRGTENGNGTLTIIDSVSVNKRKISYDLVENIKVHIVAP